MKTCLIGLMLVLAILTGCAPQGPAAPPELSGFIETLQKQGLDGDLLLRGPINPNMEYVAEYAMAKYTSTRIVSLFKCKDIEAAEATFQEALQNRKLSGQARNGIFVMAATFYPPDEEAVEKIRTLFLEQGFE
ncbi:MAG: hypothetical protein J5I92_01355 [Thiogranum sp.]|nr:hypothetical protein [Thiogranum sp.]